MSANENAVKRRRAQYFWRLKKKKFNSHCRMIKKEYTKEGFIDDSAIFW
ncbi:peroxiredoxin [Citrobacter rodentium]|uniref:Peroxiredoxin n=1 Tax=Citrobacter rodentium TaxID=67825 RepID=A0A482PVH6_CITRO|nr:peroxiredoxin [Citrobacter rodentium]HAT8014685.1 peroxiredoxin [Citrobacter rodentium NBRC 105723 = DSM 16636]HAT8019542.1 peroxiredoxin [Citrobacter rodentium]HAT8029237.1 peroxiredoxin [Citrobacter rodentium]HAT8034280.1 peroxiredoxin [Citrobacter rodentium]